MDKRASPRYSVYLNALVHPSVGRSWLCQIQDFCDGGMLLVEQNGRPRRSLPGINPGETVGIHFSVPTDSKDRHFRLEGKIVRVMDTGVGINFSSGMDDDAFTCLSDHSGLKPVVDDGPTQSLDGGTSSPATHSPPGEFLNSGLKPQDAKRVVSMIRKEVAQIIPEMTSSFFSYMDNELMELAKDAKSNAEQSEYFAAMSSMEKSKKGVGQQFIDDVLDQIDAPRDLHKLLEERKKSNEERKAQSQKKVKLSLVNTEEFEDWLAVANIISRSERTYEKYLDELLPRMGTLVDSWGHNEANPIGTSVFTHAFEDAMSNVDLTKDLRQRVYTAYERNVIPLFRKLYIAINKMLDETGLFPDPDDDYISPTAVPVQEEKEPEPVVAETPIEEDEEELELDIDLEADTDSKQAEAHEQEDDHDDDGNFDDIYDFSLDQDEDEDDQPPPAPRRSSRRRPSAEAQPQASRRRRRPSREPQQAPQRESRPRRAPDVGEAIRNIYSSVRNLLGAQNGGYDDDDQGDYDYFESEEVEDLLSTLEDEMLEVSGRRAPVRQRLMETASLVGGRKVAPEMLQSIEVVENLVDSIEEDEMLSTNTKDWIRKLEFTLDKVATRQQDFLSEENPHRSMDVINQLAMLGGAESGSAKRAVDDIVHEINTGYDEDPEVFDRALSKLKPLVERQNRAFTGNVQRTVKASEGQQTLLNAQRAVVSEMDQRYAGREIPEVLYKLLMPGWRNLLVNTHLRQGEESQDWQKHMKVLDQVFSYMDEGSDPKASPDYMEPEELLAQIEAGLDSISYEPGQRAPLVNSLRQVFSGQVAPKDLPTIALQENTIAENLGFEDVTRQDETRRKIRDEKSEDSEWQRCLDRARNLHLGDWVEFKEAKPGQEISIVAWLNGDASRFVFVNRRGVKTHDLTIEELAILIQQKKVRVMDESDIPLTDRASHRMLQNMHNQLTHQATHDDLTGLLNRKEFEHQLTIALEQAKKSGDVHACAYLDLDQFKVINNTVGHEAGDKLLIKIGELLKVNLETRDARVARLGGDEFGLLVLDCGPEHGKQIIKSVSDAVKAFRFEWESDTFSLTTSSGIYYVTEDTESVTRIMAGADSACIAAKEAGRDRIQVYSAEDSAMEYRQDIMEFVSHIDQALDKNRFELNCQKIQSIVDGEDSLHYEILLTVLDENDKPLPPEDFIIAAERYNRMGAVDRWVICNAFDFIATNILKFDHVGHFSINISGNSLTEADFMDYVLEQFDRTKLPASKICFEITETSAIGNLDDVVDFMQKMKIIGVEFSLDDFGTGLSSYSYLRNLPVDYLKIDGIFVKDIKENPSDYAVVKSINEIGHFMGKKTIAEFVEDDDIVEILREIGVDYAQGWGIGKKIPIRELFD